MDRKASRELVNRYGLPVAGGGGTLAFTGLIDGAALISFVVFPHGYAVWAWDRNGLKEKWVPSDESELSSQ